MFGKHYDQTDIPAGMRNLDNYNFVCIDNLFAYFSIYLDFVIFGRYFLDLNYPGSLVTVFHTSGWTAFNNMKKYAILYKNTM